MTKGNQNRDELIQSLQERLRWYMSEASEEEFDADEVEAIGRLLETMDGDNWEKPDAEAAYERFQAYCRERELEEKAGRYAFEAGTDSAEEFSEELAPEKAAGSLESGRAKRTARGTEAGRASATEDISSGTDAVGTEVPAGTGKRRRSGKNRVLRRTWAAVAAALCLMFLGVGGMSIALNDGEWFLKLRDRDDGEELWVVSNNELPKDDYISNTYYNYEDIIPKYQSIIVMLNLDEYGMEFDKIEIVETTKNVEIHQYYSSESSQLVIDYNYFEDGNIVLYRNAYDILDNMGKYDDNGIEYNYYEWRREDDIVSVISFSEKNILYNIWGNIGFENIRNISKRITEKK